MRARIRYTIDLLRNSYWFTPGLMMLGAIALSSLTLSLDDRWGLEAIREVEWLYRWIYTGGPDGAADVLSVIASSMITVAGVVFSITIVALTLASSQFGPRVLANFMADRANQLVLGTFVATFIYSLLILRTLRGDTAPGDTLVPYISVTVSLILALAGLSVLIFFIHHVSISIQAPHLIAVIASELRHAAKAFPPRAEAEAATARGERTGGDGFAARGDPAPIPATSTGYVEAIDYDGVADTAAEHDIFVEIEHRPGDFMVRGRPFAQAWPAERVTEEIVGEIAGMVATGSRRTAIQDVEFPIAQLVEVAVRALSPGINDPFTAMNCIDQLSAGLCDLAGRELPKSRFDDGAGATRVMLAQPVTFEGAVRAAFDQIRQNSAHHAAVYIRVLEAIATVLGGVEYVERVDTLVLQADLVLERARESVPAPTDVADVVARHRAVLAAAQATRDRLSTRRA